MSNVAMIQGRCSFVSTRDGVWYHDVQLPAPDEYSSPGWARIRANTRLYQPGEEVLAKCNVAGFRRTFQTKDGNEGAEIKVVFDFVEKLAKAKAA